MVSRKLTEVYPSCFSHSTIINMRIDASVIDYPRIGLDPDIWDVSDRGVRLVPEIKDQILDTVYSMLDDMELPIEALVKVLIYGSSITNQWNSKTDVDGRIVLDTVLMEQQYPGLTGDDIFDMVVDKIHGIKLADTKHPLNFSVVIEGEMPELGQTEADPVYDVLNDEIIQGPVFEEEYDPDELFEEDLEEVREIMEVLDELIRETKVDVIDYQTLEDAVGHVKNPDALLVKIENKIDEIELDVEELVAEYEDIHGEREIAFTEDPEDDWRRSRHWGPGNVAFKMLERYQFIDVLKKLKLIFKGGVQEEEIEDVAEALGIED